MKLFCEKFTQIGRFLATLIWLFHHKGLRWSGTTISKGSLTTRNSASFPVNLSWDLHVVYKGRFDPFQESKMAAKTDVFCFYTHKMPKSKWLSWAYPFESSAFSNPSSSTMKNIQRNRFGRCFNSVRLSQKEVNVLNHWFEQLWFPSLKHTKVTWFHYKLFVSLQKASKRNLVIVFNKKSFCSLLL